MGEGGDEAAEAENRAVPGSEAGRSAGLGSLAVRHGGLEARDEGGELCGRDELAVNQATQHLQSSAVSIHTIGSQFALPGRLLLEPPAESRPDLM